MYTSSAISLKENTVYNQDYLGTIWDNIDLEKLYNLKAKNTDWEECAIILRRSPGACKAKWRALRTGLMFIKGRKSDTLSTFDVFAQ